jgi:hypothetical protein
MLLVIEGLFVKGFILSWCFVMPLFRLKVIRLWSLIV